MFQLWVWKTIAVSVTSHSHQSRSTVEYSCHMSERQWRDESSLQNLIQWMWKLNCNSVQLQIEYSQDMYIAPWLKTWQHHVILEHCYLCNINCHSKICFLKWAVIIRKEMVLTNKSIIWLLVGPSLSRCSYTVHTFVSNSELCTFRSMVGNWKAAAVTMPSKN